MTQQQPTVDEAAATAASERPAYQPIAEQDEWLEESEQLPRRPRRRLLTPLPLALLAVLAIAGGFIAGVLVEKGQSGSASASATGAGGGLAARFAAPRGGSSTTGTTAAGAAASAAPAGRSTGAGGLAAGGGATSGQVAYVSGDTLYVTTAEGNTVKVTTSAGSAVTKTVKASVKGIHPGETVVVTGTTGASGAISAQSIRVGTAGAGGLGLFGGSRSGSTGAGGNSSSAGGEPALFGNGG